MNKLDLVALSYLAIYFQESIFSFDGYKNKIYFSILAYCGLVYLILRLLKKYILTKSINHKSIICVLFTISYFLTDEKKPIIVPFIATLFILEFKSHLKLYTFFYKIITIICFLGLINYILFLLGVNFDFSILDAQNELKKASGVYYIKNYFLSLIVFPGTGILYRFQSIFEEPGTLGTLLGMLILFDGKLKKLKIERIIIILSGLLTLSTAFYIFLIFKYISYPMKNLKKMTISLVIILGFFFAGELLKSRNKDFYDKTFNKVLISYKQNNRESNEAKEILNSFIKTKESIIGTGRKFYKDYPGIDISSWRMIIYQKGFVSLIILLLYLLYISEFKKRVFLVKLSIVFYLLSIYQRPGIISVSNIIILICGSSYFQNQIIYKNKLDPKINKERI